MTLAALAACGGSPVSPSSGKPPSPPWVVVTCTASATLRCSASVYGEGDITASATWSAAEAFLPAMDVPLPSSSAVVFPTPGLVQVLRPQNVYIRADYLSPTWGHLRSIAPHAYGLDPAEPPVPLAYLSGTTVPGGVTVEIIEGEDTGRKDVSREDNGFYMIEFLRLGSPFTVRASKAGYAPEVKTHPGIVDGVTGYPTNSSLHFSLSPLQ
jgi:hypothetical protein